MEFKDRLKKLRGARGVSQESLARSIYISRSAVAKWENGLGLPSKASYEALLQYFSIDESELPLGESEELIVSKNKKIRILAELLVYVAIITIVYISCRVYFACKDGFGFTSEMAAGKWWRDEERIETEDYDFYYDTMNDGNGNPVVMDTFAAVSKKGLFYNRVSIDEDCVRIRQLTSADGYEGRLYTFLGDGVYYHIFRSAYRTSGEGPLITLLGETLYADGVEYSVTYNSFFITDREIDSFTSQFDKEFFIENIVD